MSNKPAMVEVENLVRDYLPAGQLKAVASRRVRALDGVSFSVAEGTLFGILGPNGAGKTTMIKILTTVVTPTKGSARIFGYDVIKEAHRIRPRIGVAYGGDLGLYWRLNGLDNLVFAGQLQGIGMKESRARAWELLEQFELKDAAKKRVDSYSRGMRQRLHVARCLIHDPDLIFLDEPTSGLDPAASRNLRQLIKQMKQMGKTIILTTHNMSEADSMCDHVAIIAKGKMAAMGTPDEIKRSLDTFCILEVKLDNRLPLDLALLGKRLGLSGDRAALSCEQTESGTVIRLRYKGAAPVRSLVKALDNMTILEITTRGNTLEEAYLKLLEERGA